MPVCVSAHAGGAWIYMRQAPRYVQLLLPTSVPSMYLSLLLLAHLIKQRKPLRTVGTANIDNTYHEAHIMLTQLTASHRLEYEKSVTILILVAAIGEALTAAKRHLLDAFQDMLD